jgi:integrase
LSGSCIVQRGKRFSVVCYAGVDPESKKQRQRWFGGFKTRREAEQFRLTLAHHPSFAGGVGPYGSPQLRTGDYIAAWLREREGLRELREQTHDRYEELIRCHIVPALGHIPLARLGPTAVQQLYVTMVSIKGLSTTTARQAAAVLHVALRTAVRRGLILRNPCDNTTPPPRAKFEPTVFTQEQVAKYLKDAREKATPAVYALHVTALTTGLRLGELLGLPEVAVDLRSGLLTVQQQLVRAGRHPVYGQPKTARGRRTVLLPPVATEAIRKALVWKKERKLRLGPKFHDVGLLFCGSRGRPLNPANLWNRDHVPRIERLGLPRTRLHDMRHFHATTLVANGVDARTVADRLGHASVAFTLQTYAHAAVKAQQYAATVANDSLMKTVGVHE